MTLTAEFRLTSYHLPLVDVAAAPPNAHYNSRTVNNPSQDHLYTPIGYRESSA